MTSEKSLIDEFGIFPVAGSFNKFQDRSPLDGTMLPYLFTPDALAKLKIFPELLILSH